MEKLGAEAGNFPEDGTLQGLSSQSSRWRQDFPDGPRPEAMPAAFTSFEARLDFNVPLAVVCFERPPGRKDLIFSGECR